MLNREHFGDRVREVRQSDLDTLAVRMRRLVLHRAYSREEIVSPALKRLMPPRALYGMLAPDVASLRERVRRAGVDARMVDYLLHAVETEMDSARLRLT